VALVRSDNIYGGGDFNWSRLVPGTIRSILGGETPVIRSSGLLQRDYVYVEDTVAAYIAIGERLDDTTVKGKLFRVATGVRTSVLDMVKQIARAAGRSDLKPQVLNEKSEERIDVFYTPEFEQTVLGWKSRYSLEEGLSRTCQWYRAFFKGESKTQMK
jgi:CDP-glucose 4,6-dehydratase